LRNKSGAKAMDKRMPAKGSAHGQLSVAPSSVAAPAAFGIEAAANIIGQGEAV